MPPYKHTHDYYVYTTKEFWNFYSLLYNMYYYYYVFLSSVVIVPTNRYLITLFFLPSNPRSRIHCSDGISAVYTRFSSCPNDRLIDTNRHVKNSRAVCACVCRLACEKTSHRHQQRVYNNNNKYCRHRRSHRILDEKKEKKIKDKKMRDRTS